MLYYKPLASCRSPTALKRPDRSKQCHCLQFAKCIASLLHFFTNALNSRLFAKLCKESDFMFENLLLRTRVRWLLKGKVLTKVFLLQKEIQEFLYEVKPEMHKNFADDRFFDIPVFFSGLFESVNSVNLALQGKEENVLYCHEKLSALNMKLILWHFKSNKKTLLLLQTVMNFWMKINFKKVMTSSKR